MMDFDHDEIFENFEDEFQKRKRKKRQGTSIPPWMYILFILIIIFTILFIRRNPKPQELISETTLPSAEFTETSAGLDRTLSSQLEAESEMINTEQAVERTATQPAAIQTITDNKVEIQPSGTIQSAVKIVVSDQPRTPIVIKKTPVANGQEMISTPVEASILSSPTTNYVAVNSDSSQTIPPAIRIIPTKPLNTQPNTVIVTINVPSEEEIIETAFPAEEIRNDPVAVNAVTVASETIGTETQVYPDATNTVVPNQDTTKENENWFRKFINFWKRLFGLKPSVSSTATVTATAEENPSLTAPIITETTAEIIYPQATETQMNLESTPVISESVQFEPSPLYNSPTTIIPTEVLSIPETIIAEPKTVEEPKQEEENLSLIQKLLESIQRLFHKEPEMTPTFSVIEEHAKQESENGTADLQTVSTLPMTESQTENEANQKVVGTTDEPINELPNAISGPAGTSEVAYDKELLAMNPSSMKDVEITATYSDLDDEPLKFEDVDYSNEPTRTPISEITSEPLPTEITPAVTKIDLVRIITLPVTKLTPVRQQATVTISAGDSGATFVPIIRETMLPETGFADRINLPMVIFVIMILLAIILSARVIRTKRHLK